MTERAAMKVDAAAGAPIIRSITGMEERDRGPDQYIDLQYSDRGTPDFVRVSARNHHPDKTIKAHFYSLEDDGSGFIPGSWPDRTITACLKPSESAVLRFEEKKHNPRVFLFNAIFIDGD